MKSYLFLLASGAALASGLQTTFPAAGPATLRTAAAEFLVARDGGISARLLDGRPLGATVLGGRVGGSPIRLDFQGATTATAAGATRVAIPWRSAAGLDGTLTLEALDAEPGTLAGTLAILNAQGDPGPVSVLGRRMAAKGLLSFQGSSYDWGKDEIVAPGPGFTRPNVMGTMVEGGCGGGIPVAAFWNRAQGEAVGTLDGAPCAIPVRVDGQSSLETAVTFQPGPVPAGGAWTSPPSTWRSSTGTSTSP